MKPSVIDICTIILLSAMIVILPQDRLSDRAMCQNSVETAKIEPAINLSRPDAVFEFTIEPPVTRGPRAHLREPHESRLFLSVER